MSHYVAASSPYSYRLPPDTFLSRRDPGWYIGALSTSEQKARDQYLNQMKPLVEEAKRELTTLLDGKLSRSGIWLLPGGLSTKILQQRSREGIIRARDQLDTYLSILTDALADPSRNLVEIINTSKDFWKTHAVVVGGWLGLSNLGLDDGFVIGLNMIAEAAISTASKSVEELVKGAARGFENAASRNPAGLVLLAGGIVAALALYFVIQKKA